MNQPNQTNQTNQINQTNQTNHPLEGACFLLSKRVCFSGHTMAPSTTQRATATQPGSQPAHRIEVVDDIMAEVLRKKTPAERLAIGFGLWRSARMLLRGQLRSLHPEWDAAQLDREVARRLSHGAV
jgi:hypothetical protein